MAKKKKHGERVSFRFDERAGRDEKTIDLFGPDEDELSEEPESEGETPSEGFRVPKSFDTPLEDEDEAPEKPKKADKPSDTPTFRFDRYGRRIGKRAHYGKRKDAPRATTTVVEHDTEAKREYEEARRRSEARAKRRAREEAKAAELKKAQRKEKWRRSAATFALGILALVVLALLAWFTTRLNKIEITNIPQGYTEEQIIELSGLEPSLNKKSALFISTKKVEDRIRQDPYLEATVRYSFPSKIRITLSKREEAACVLWGPVNEYLAIIDKNGIVLNDRAETANGLLIAEGMSISSAVNGSRLGDSSDTRVEALIRLLQKLNDRDLMNRTPRINRIDMTELMQIRMYLEGMPNYTIELGSVSLLDSSLDRLQRNWSEIMRYASEQTQGGAMNVTIYLYGKDGPYVSPYEPGYVTPTQAPVSPRPSASPGNNPESTPNPGPEETPYEPQPQVTPMPHQDEPFTG